jgi:hypothetical protein
MEGGTVDECGEGEEVEGLIEGLPGVGAAVLADDLLVEAVGAGDLAAWGRAYRDSWLPRRRKTSSG